MSANASDGVELVRHLGRWQLVAYGINFIVGASVFGLPSKIYALSGPASLLAYALCAGATILIVVCFAEVSSRYTQTGGPYLYAREAFGPLVGFEVGWLRWLSGVATFAANVNLLTTYAGYFLPPASTGLGRVLVITGTTVALTSVNVAGIRSAAMTSNFFAVTKLLPLFLFVAVGAFFVDPQRVAIAAAPSYAALSTSVLLLVHAFSGFESMSIPAGEVRDPQRTVPFALFTAIAIVTVLYLGIQAVCIGTLPELAASATPLADAGSRFLGPAAGYLIAAVALVSIGGNLNGQLLVTPRTMFAMAEHGQLPRVLAAVHERFRTPHAAIILSSAVILGFALSGTFIGLLKIAVLARLAVYAAGCAALPALRRRRDVPAALFRAPAGSLVAVVAIGLCVWLLASSTQREAVTTLVAAGIGLVVYAVHGWRKERRA